MSDGTRQRILVVDDHPLLRKGVSQLVALDPDLEMVGEAASGAEGVALAIALEPDLILLDLNMKGMTGLEALKRVKAAGLDAHVVVLTVSDSEYDVVAALRAGADGYLLKDMEPEELLESLRRAAAGKLVLSPGVTDLLARALRQEALPRSADEAGLTDREQLILAQIATGASNKIIARALGITEGTVKVHVKNLLKKLRLRSRTEAAVWAVEHGRAAAGRATESSLRKP